MSQREIVRGGGALFADPGPDGFLHRAFLRGGGAAGDAVGRQPVIGIATSWSELSPCNAGLREVAEAVKRGIADAGGSGLVFPTISLSEPYVRPTSMLLRNLMSMDVEEMVLSSPIDGVVVLGGCDKTVPAQLMGAVSAGKPTLAVTAGPRPVACWKDAPLTIDDVWPAIERRRLGEIDDAEWAALERALNPGPGTCNVLGTAISMAAAAEVLGFALPGTALIPAGTAAQLERAADGGRRIVDSVSRGVTPADLVTLPAIENAVRIVCAVGGSTNALIHLVAIAGRAGVRVTTALLRDWTATTPLLADVRPTGTHLLSDLDAAGGIPAVVRELGDLFHLDRPTALGHTWREEIATATAPPAGSGVLRSAGNSVAERSLVVLTGSLAPGGAVAKLAPGRTGIVRHRGRAVVFEGVDDLNSRIDDDALEVDSSSVLVLRGVGIKGAPGMPEVGHLPIPARLARAGVTDMVRITDARMSGTAVGTVVLHVTPESAAGGPLALVRDGDEIELDLVEGRLDLLVDSATLSERRVPDPAAPPPRGYARLFDIHVLQPDDGCDFDFLRAVADD